MFGLETAGVPTGYVDHFSNGVLYGWAWIPTNPRQRLNVDVFHDGIFLGQFAASFFRSDLQANGIGDGRYSFQAHLLDELARDAQYERLEVFTSLPQRIKLIRPGERRRSALLARFAQRNVTERVREMFHPLLDRLASVCGAEHNHGAPEIDRGKKTPLFTRLLGPSPIKGGSSLHGQTLSAYVDHIRHKYELADVYNISIGISQYDGYFKWYLEHYSAIKGAKRAPLSSDEIKYLNSLVELDTDHKITRAASFFLEDHFGSTVRNELLSETCYDQLVYWWSVEESRRLFVEDCLVPKDHIHQLQRIQIESTDVDYPISTFIKTFISKNAVFNGLSVNKTDHRKLIYFTIMLYALRLPHILRYLPERWIENILWARVNGKTIFEEKMILVFGDASKLTSEIYAARMGLLGSDNQRERSAPSEIEAGRIFAATLPRPDRAMNDIQIIGPFGRILGLGHSCTILSRLIGKLGYSVNLVDFDLENNSPINCSAEIKISPLASARINILHLNAEIIPAAIAYMPDVFTNAFNIAFCYWELDSPADCQLLGLMLPDEIWVASAFTARAFGPYCRSLINVGTTYDVGPRIGHTAARKLFQSYNITDTDFVFLNVSDALSGVQRKNPMAAIRAFTAAFPENKQVKLIIKTHNVKHSASPNWRNVWKSIAEVAAADSRIILIDETFSRAKHLALIEASDCFVSLHRSEGLGLGLMEAFILGVPVMTTAYSGVLEFCNNDNAWLIDYDEILLNASDYAFVKPGHKWANPNPVSAITAMLEIYSDTSKRTRLAKNGRRYLEENFSPEIIAGRIHSRLCEILGK